MEKITFEQVARELIRQLEGTLARLAVSADAGISTYSLEAKATKLASKIKASAEMTVSSPKRYKSIEYGGFLWR